MIPRAGDPWVLLAIMATVLAVTAVGIGMAQSAEAATIIVPDDYGTIQEAIDNATAGDTIRVYAGTYDGEVVVNLAIHIVGNGTAETIVQSIFPYTLDISANGASVSSVQVRGATDSGIRITGDGNTIESVLCTGNARGLGLYGADSNHIGNTTCTGNTYAGVGVYSGSDDNLFLNVSCDANGNFGLDVFSNSDGNTWEGCSFDENSGNGVLINGGADGNTIANSSMDGNGQYGFSLTQSSYTTVFGCSASNNTDNHGLVIYDTISFNLISHLIVDSNGLDGIYVDGDSDSRYDNITATNNGDRGMGLNNSDHIEIQHSIFSRSTNYGMAHFQNTNVAILDNVINDNTYGCFLDACQDYSIGRNTIVDNDGHGIALQNSGGVPGNRVFENEISRNAVVLGGFEAGIFLVGFSSTDSNVIEDNSITGNQKGIVFLFNAANNNIIRGNHIKDSKVFGVEYFFNPGPNTFYNNNFINNPTHVQSPNAADTYDNGYPSGGNYWDTYTGKDEYSGPAQNIWGPDSIGDTNHVVSGAVVDNYPLVEVFNDPMDSILIVSPDEGDLVSGVVAAEAIVVSSSVTQVSFYLDGVMVGRDTYAPFQHVLDSTALAEDGKFVLTAVASRRFGIPISDQVTFGVNNQVMKGGYIGVATVSSAYRPDDRATAMVTLSMPPAFDEISLHAEYEDSSGNRTMLPDMPYMASMRYGFTFWLPSDIPAGTVTLEVTGRAYLRGSEVWRSTNTTTFAVAGDSHHQEMAVIMATLSKVLAEIDGMNITTQAQLAVNLAATLAAIDGLGTSMEATLSQMWADYNTTEDANLLTVVTSMAAMWDGINTSARMGFDEVLAGIDMSETNITDGLDTLEAFLAGEIQLSQLEVQQSLDQVWQGLNASFISLNGAIQVRLDQLEGGMADNSTALREYIGLQTVQLELYMDVINASVQLRLDAIDEAIMEFRMETLEELLSISTFLVAMEANGTDQYGDVMEAIDDTQMLVDNINDTSLADLRNGLVGLRDDLLGLNTSEADRHALTLDATITGLDGLSDQVDDGITQTDAQLQALGKLDTILAELDRMSADLEDTKETVSEGGSGTMWILLLLLLVALMTLGLIIVGMQKIRAMRLAQQEPPAGGGELLEPIPIEAPIEAPIEPEVAAPAERDFELMMEEPIMYPPSNGPIIMDVEEVPPPPPEAPVAPAARPEETWAEEILGAEGVAILDETPEAEAAEVIFDDTEVEEIHPDEVYDVPDQLPPEEPPGMPSEELEEVPEEEPMEAPPEEPFEEPPEEPTEEPPEEPPEEPVDEEGPTDDLDPEEGDDEGPEEEPQGEEMTTQDWVLEEVIDEI